ncbi:hypothetical protein COW80_01740 [Candidatus Beckwithbacteria bacterium CG22_combo_CG10-13_8_21_14_all_01_47_9]|uniref:Uncharacterized protein n=1 Tax=Candidatus Beckwithbacteria bacterium CG22_combo_CG10-13_8_21_14_all_01_47_9 TaxID=1974496 RepID=A0A2H0E174_9BACT|nr:MAG: hypothetical protein COW80_01740 [Candidatus Beckwithbacteria bacterium CG22_combo_CG10-13_8_21_14_all_01_47_9]
MNIFDLGHVADGASAGFDEGESQVRSGGGHCFGACDTFDGWDKGGFGRKHGFAPTGRLWRRRRIRRRQGYGGRRGRGIDTREKAGGEAEDKVADDAQGDNSKESAHK